MSAPALEGVLQRDRVVVATALAVVALLAWAYIAWLAAGMAAIPAEPAAGGMDMAGMDMGSATAPAIRAWGAIDVAFILAMWAVMMVGMMTPSVAPVVLLYAGVERKARRDGRPIASAGWFFAGYILVWVGFSVVATGAQWGLASVSLLSPAMALASNVLGGIVLVAAGVYQWTPLKEACLRQCQSPAAFLTSRGGLGSAPTGAIRLGVEHGLYCLGCCWALMALLFVGGIMNVVWIAGIAILILAEKVVPSGLWISRISGIALAAAGGWLLFGTLASPPL